ncbi:hypothetical protein A1Q2_07175 [Trichosporon asahii var. asahii CBS 8904]|uniref:Uncharacterized protein n=1 Tax=Trichosporon asahii var. asahii (strain CBS 8904) TaxID=1220162 RepID=K1V3P9_TRIAC|nr:hypothetical protein A1Q2_07175 [Trichosporon asahii var. asahii CBS 8904]
MLSLIIFLFVTATLGLAAPIARRSESTDAPHRSGRSLGDLSPGEIAGMVLGIVLGLLLVIMIVAQATNGSRKMWARYRAKREQRKADQAEIAASRAQRALEQNEDDDRTAAWLAGRARNFSSLPSSVIDLPGTPEPAYYQEPKSLDEQLFTGTALRSSFELPPPAYPQDETGKSETKKLSVSK